MCHNFLIHSSASWHVGCFHVLIIVDNAGQWTLVYMCLFSSGFLGGIAGLYVRFISIFLRSLHTVLHSGCISLHSYQQCKKFPYSWHLLKYLLFVDFWIIAIRTGVRWQFIVVLSCISLLISDVEHLFICLLAICISSSHLGLLLTFWLGCSFF